ncbi:hypothetical protein NG798_09950 [Ancylothrix sp. C2]|uniref:hypothetical protein n=1 Tax=Ancylothrix sp. D3o TaxID=2953691 RepID=UPI0021BAF0D1|nr:hypothetical protein [Ancylothrix sp. D3o]MCT7950108.1 hypothetical protein [Ancylothrix sp. D3o]
MKIKSILPLLTLTGTTLFTLPSLAQNTLQQLAGIAASPTPAEANLAISQLRQQGPAGIDAFINLHADKLQPNSKLASQTRASLQTALDTICAQRDCYASKLYWYTDLEQAKQAAAKTGKPILSLHLLGKLNEELSCANSRFFRIALYPNAQISQYLRENYILHWQSVRPAPRVTIDFGDGRKLERTLTGNSIHYILDSNGRPIEALPGLYGPQAFLKHIAQINNFVKSYNNTSPQQQQTLLRQYHQQRLSEIETSWQNDFLSLGQLVPPLPSLPNTAQNQPTALEAAPGALSKMATEMPVLRSITPSAESITPAPNNSPWVQLAELHTADARLDSNSITLMQSKNSNYKNLENLQKVLPNFERNIALDTVRNEYLFHRQLHQWFINGNSTGTLEKLNERVYAELFLTPSSDPWLGLLPGDAYTGIENDGMF